MGPAAFLLLFASLFVNTNAFYRNSIEVYFCVRPISHTVWNNAHHEIWMRDEYGGTTLISFQPSGPVVQHGLSAHGANQRCTFTYKGLTSIARYRELYGHIDAYRASYHLVYNNCQHFAQQALSVLQPR